MEKFSISLTDEHAVMIKEAVSSGDYASSSEVVREALRDWRVKQTMRRFWDEGMAGGPASPPLNFEEIKAEARKRAGID